MKRREFLSTVVEAPASEQEGDQKLTRRKFVPSEFANRALPVVPRSSAGLEPYTGTWGPTQVSHLLRRTMFGARPQDVATASGMSVSDLVDLLLTEPAAPDPPINTNINDTGSVVGTTWINAPTSTSNASRHNSMRAWWVDQMLTQGMSLREKMTLFWHNHFATETAVVSDARVSYRTNALLRQHALGNFKVLTGEVTVDCGMLKYLNGNTNTASNPNENYARELQELFTIGKGPEIAPENYTNYTEQDVQQAARVLSGWRDDKTTFTGYFTAGRHDSGDKQFSSAYGNTVITGQTGTAGANEVDDLLDMIFLQNETARYICRKLYRWFVYYVIDSAAEANVITPMADIFRSNNYDIKPALAALLKSAHFFDPVNFGCMIKSPIDLTVGTARAFSVAYPDTSNLTSWQNHRKYLHDQSTTMQQQIGDPPNVAGWPAYYQDPLFYEMWINSDTLANRTEFTDILSGTGYTRNGFKQIIDPVAFANLTSAPALPDTLINEWAGFLYAFDITPAQKAFLKEALLPGLPDYEWTIEWTDYVNDPTDPGKTAAITTKLRELLGVMLAMPEYQLM
jgi:uncharacterized protein (DUF1800 family)